MTDAVHPEGMSTPQDIATAYFDNWRAKDFDAFRALLDDDVTFAGPLGTAEGADACRAGIEGMSAIVTDVVVQHRWVDGEDVLTWFDLHTSVAPPAPTANWSRVVDGRIVRIRVAFDPRALAPPGA